MQRMPACAALAVAVPCGFLTFVFCIAALLAGASWAKGQFSPTWSGDIEGTAIIAAVLTGVILWPLLTLYMWRRLRWRYIDWDDSTCWACGYDLTGNSTGICSECGRVLRDFSQIGAQAIVDPPPAAPVVDYVLATRTERMAWYWAGWLGLSCGAVFLVLSSGILGAILAPMQTRYPLAAPAIWFIGIACALVGAVLVVLRAYAALRWQWKMWDEKTCWGCGYDLTGNLSGKCPECGNEYTVEMRGTIHEHRSDVRTPQ
jgi:predicted RNA-binding Zn-ribbon protein involved in translation (DUF1610 family)